MSDAKFTKGEWYTFQHGIGCNGMRIATMLHHGDNDVLCIDEHAANANLIAAAPEMYEMLDSAMCRLADEVDDEARRIVKKIIALRKKARGES